DQWKETYTKLGMTPERIGQQHFNELTVNRGLERQDYLDCLGNFGIRSWGTRLLSAADKETGWAKVGLAAAGWVATVGEVVIESLPVIALTWGAGASVAALNAAVEAGNITSRLAIMSIRALSSLERGFRGVIMT